MRRFNAPELVQFLTAMDDLLCERASLTVIGGAAAALQHGATRPTSDIDTFQPLPEAVTRAAAEARRSTRLDIAVSFAAVADAPYDYEDRLERVASPKLQHLEL